MCAVGLLFVCRVGEQDPFLVFFRGGTGYFPEDLRKIGAVVEATFHGDLGHFGAFLRQPVLGGGDAGDGNIIVQPHAGDLFEQLGKVTGADSVFSGKKIQYFDPELNQSYTPYVFETSIGVDRVFLSVMAGSYCEETLENGETRVVLKLPAALAPIKLAVLPLVKKDGLPEKAREIIDSLKFHFHCQYDEKDSIGKRYRRQDAIGTPYCVTVDHQTLDDNCVTLRNRDTMQQERVAIAELNNIIADRVSITSLLKGLQ